LLPCLLDGVLRFESERCDYGLQHYRTCR
jgi:hypothetical protein